ncbi:unnamed protein product [Tilletia controversa]|nr:unnamed protein product [Tilletia controversa]
MRPLPEGGTSNAELAAVLSLLLMLLTSNSGSAKPSPVFTGKSSGSRSGAAPSSSGSRSLREASSSARPEHKNSTRSAVSFRNARQTASSGDVKMPSLGAAFQPQPGAVKEHPEAYQSVLIWQPTVVRTTGARAALTKAPIIRDVPQVRRKLTNRNSTSGLRTLAVSNAHASGVWKRGTLHFRDNGILLIYSDEHSLLQSIACEDLCTNHIRKVDSSLFGRTLAMGIFARPSTLTPLSPRARLNSTASDEPIYLCFYTRAALHKWLYLLRIFAQPEVYGSPLSVSKGGTHRFYRQLDMTINGVRSLSHTTSADLSALSDGAAPTGARGPIIGSRPISTIPGQDRDFDSSTREDTILQCYCVVRSGPYAIAKTKVHSTTSTALWLEKFSIGDLPPWTTLTIELMQSQRGGKTALFGVVELPVQTMRRGEDIDGWFPIWSTGRAGGGRDHAPVLSSAADPASAYSRELIGELRLIFHVRDEVIMPRRRYDNVSQILNSDKFIPLVSVLTKVVDEQNVLGHLVDVFASSGTIVPRLADLTQAETDAMNEGSELELLFSPLEIVDRSVKHQNMNTTLATVSVGKASTPISMTSLRHFAKTSPGRRRGATVSASGSGHREPQRMPASTSIDENGRRTGELSTPSARFTNRMSASNGLYDSDEELRAAYRIVKDQGATPDEAGPSGRTNRPHSSEGVRMNPVNVGGGQGDNDEGSLHDGAPGHPDSSVTSLRRYGESRRKSKWWQRNK